MTSRRASLPLLAAAAALFAIHLAGALIPRSPMFDGTFGIEAWRHLGLVPLLVAGAALFALLLVPGAADRTAAAAAALGAKIPPRARIPAAAALFAAACLLLPNRTMSGDAGSVLYFAAIGRIHPSNALTSFWFEFLGSAFDLDPVTVIQISAALSGAVYAAAVTAIARELAPPGPRRAGIAAVLLATGGVAIFFGTIEVYAPLVAALAVYFLFAIREFGGKGAGFAAPLALGVAFSLHGSAGLLLPSLVLLANGGRILPIAPLRIVRAGALFLVPVALTFAGLWFVEWGGEPPSGQTNRFGTFFGSEGEGALLPIVHDPEKPRQRYAIFDLEHAAGVANLLLLVAPVGIALFMLGPRPWRDPVFRFTAVAAAFLVLYPNVWNVSYALRHDWDLFSLLGPALALLGAIAWFRIDRPAADATRVAALAVFCTLPLVIGNHVRERERLAYAEIVEEHLQQGVPAAMVEAAIDDFLAGRAAEGAPVEDFERRDVRADLAGLLVGALVELRAVEPVVPEFEANRFETEIRQALANHPHPAVRPEILAAPLAEGTAALLSRTLADRAVVAPGILAYGAVDRVVKAGLLPPPGPEEPERADLVVLDAIDETLETGGSFRLVRSQPTGADLERTLSGAMKAFVVEWDLTADPTLLTYSLARSLERVLAADRPEGRRWRRLATAADEWRRRQAQLGYPGRKAAIQRTEWLLDPSTPDGIRATLPERYARHGVARRPEDAWWRALLGEALEERGRMSDAAAAYREAAAAAPWRIGPRIRLAAVLHELGKTDEALRILLRGLRVDGWSSRAPFALLHAATLRMERGEREIAKAHAREAAGLLDRVPHPGARRQLAAEVRAILDGR